jgi:hypothetical protein
MKKLFIALILSFGCHIYTYAQSDFTYQINSKDVNNGYVTEKIWLSRYALPKVQISGIVYNTVDYLPFHTPIDRAEHFNMVLGMERKRPFVFVRIPVYNADASTNKFTKLSGFTLRVTEQPAPGKTGNVLSAARTTSASSVLAKGTWFKIGVTTTGLYKIDYDYLAKSGVSTSSISLNNIRVFGNGGNMLSEDNSVPRINDLAENAIWVSDANSNGVFDKGDFFVFYATGPLGWLKDSIHQKFTHQTNVYSDTAYYFLNFDSGPGLRIAQQTGTLTPNKTVSDFNAYLLHENETENVGPFGRQWWGEQFSSDPGKVLTQTFSFTTGPVTDSIECNILVGSRGPNSGNTFQATLNSQPVGSVSLGSAGQNEDDIAMSEQIIDKKLSITGPTAGVTLSYTQAGPSNNGYLDYIELNYRRSLTMNDVQMNFRDWKSTGTGNIAKYNLTGANVSTQVWDVTTPTVPVLMNGSYSGGTYTFTQDAARLHEFVAMNSPNLLTPTFIGQIPNQDLHGMPQANLIIVTYPGYLDAANRLADFHRNNDHINVAVATTTQVYNEFSSGSQDISAIRDFAKMFYDRAGTDSSLMPHNILLFGDASYDYKNRIPNNENFVPTYESIQSIDPVSSYASDDFFGFLDDNDNIENYSIFNALDVGVGRLPVDNINDAQAVVDKVIAYKSTASLGPWRISATMVADNEDDAGPHMSDAEGIANEIKASTTSASSTSIYNFTKVYVDAIPTVSTPGGTRCPNANQTIDNQVYKGTFFINYTGHGNTQVWASERVLTQDDYNNWDNLYKLPFTVTATCDFGQFDNPAFVSAGEGLVVKNNGGVIVALTTTQQTYESENKVIDQDFIKSQFTHYSDGSWNTFGDAFRKGKNLTYAVSGGDLSNFRKFALLGDPAVLPDFPTYNIRTESIKNGTTHAALDTVSALGSYIISGSVVDAANNVLTDFNGTLYVTIFDKARTVPTITGIGKTFDVQDNIIYRGKVTVTNGRFSYSFISPKDINYIYGYGRISYYADNGITDAAGGEDTIINVGGYSENPVTSDHGPVVKPYMNDTLFQNGGVTGPNSILYVKFFDETGINVSGNTVGHDLTAVLDGDIQNPYNLNDFYETLPNTYQYGYVSFPINGLTTGKHTITVKAWDVNDNSGEGSVDFVVADSNTMALQNILAYPNPFRDVVHFVFDHNHPGEQLDVEISIYNSSGYPVRSLKQSFVATGSRSDDITWDGTSNNYAKLPSGVYICRIKVSDNKGIMSMGYQKVVLIR